MIGLLKFILYQLEGASTGVVACDSSSRVIGALAKKIPIPSAVAMVEALACRRAMFFAKELCLFDCIFEGDAEVIVKAIQKADASHPEHG